MRATVGPASGVPRNPNKQRPAKVYKPPGTQPGGAPFAPVGAVTFKPAQRQARQQVRQAQQRVPGPALPLKQFPHLKSYTPAQRQAIVRAQAPVLRRAGVTSQAQVRQASNLSDRQTRQALHQYRGVLRTADQRRLEHLGVDALARNPQAFGAPSGSSVNAARWHRMIGTNGAISGATREFLREIGQGQVSQSMVRNGRLRGGRHTHLSLPFGVATIDTTHLASALSAAIQRGSGVPGVGRLATNLGADLYHYPVQSIKGIAQLAVAGVQAAPLPGLMNPKPLERIGQGLISGPGGLALRGKFAEAGRVAGEHPLSAILDAAALYGGVGRLAGAGARAGAFGDAGRAAGALARDPLQVVPGTNLMRERGYSPNLFTSAIQRAHENSLRARGLDPNLARPKAFGGQGHEINQTVDEFAAQNDALRRVGRSETARGANAALAVLPKHERAVAWMMAERRIHPLKGQTFEQAVRAERDRLDAVYKAESQTKLTFEQRKENRTQAGALNTLLKHGITQDVFDALDHAAHAIKGHADTIKQDLIAQNALDPHQALISEVRPYAVARMGLRYDRAKRPLTVAKGAFDQARAAERQAAQAAKEARGLQRKAEDRLQQMRGGAAVHRGRRVQGGARAGGRKQPTRPVDARRIAAQEAKVQRLRSATKQATTDFRAARDARIKANPKLYETGLVDAQGNRVTTDQIVQHMRDNGVPMPAFLTHRHDLQGARAYFQNAFGAGRKTADAKGKRTGEATRTGGHASSAQALQDALVSQRGLSDAIGGWDRFVGQFGAGPSRADIAALHDAGFNVPADARAFTMEEAQYLTDIRGSLENAPNPGEVPRTPIRSVPGKYSEAERNAILDSQAAGQLPPLHDFQMKQLQARLDPTDQTSRNVQLVPTQAFDRFKAHQLAATSTAGRIAQALTGAFRGTVLPFSPKWLFGNVGEAVLRSVVFGVTPLDHNIGKRLEGHILALDAAKAREFETRVQSGLMFGTSERLGVHRDSTVADGTLLAPVAHGLATISRTQPMQLALDGLRTYQHTVFSFNTRMERAFQLAAVGKTARREMQAMTGSWGKSLGFQEAALQDLARGLLGTPKQVRFARSVDEILGKYNRFSPTTRRIIQTAMPFLPWYLNSLRFVFWTLPAKHPVKTALLLNVEHTFQKQFQQPNVPPGDLESAIPQKDGGLLNLARYTPFGAFTNLPDGIGDVFVPQISSALAALQGRSFTGSDLKVPGGSRAKATRLQRVGIALYSALESFVPALSIARRLREHGQTPYDNSTVWSPKTKPGTAHGTPGIVAALNRTLNPIRPIYLHPGAPRAGVAANPDAGLSPTQQALREAQRSLRPAGGGLSETQKALREAARSLAGR